MSKTTNNIQAKNKSRSMLWQIAGRLMHNKPAMIGLIILVLVAVISFIGPSLCKYGINDMTLKDARQGPSLEHFFGTDTFGRDIFVRLLYGARFSLLLGLAGALSAFTIGVVLGLIDGYFGGTYDIVFMRFLDIWSAIPGVLMSILISTLLGSGFTNTIIALAVGNVPLIVRLTRGQILSVRKEEYLEAALTINANPARIMFRHLLPNVVSPAIVSTTMNVGSIIVAAASLSYLGLGIQPPNPEWGAMLSAGKSYSMYYPWMMWFPGLAIALVVLCVNMFGDGLRDAIDPKLKQ